jgi:hypothetical protein
LVLRLGNKEDHSENKSWLCPYHIPDRGLGAGHQQWLKRQGPCSPRRFMVMQILSREVEETPEQRRSQKSKSGAFQLIVLYGPLWKITIKRHWKALNNGRNGNCLILMTIQFLPSHLVPGRMPLVCMLS